MSDNLLDLTICLEISKRFPCERAVDFQTIDEGGDGDEAVGLDILLELIVGLLVEDHGVVGLVLDCVEWSVATFVKRSDTACWRQWRSLNWRKKRLDLARDAFEIEGMPACVVRYHIPLPFDHFFFCFLPPVAAGACENRQH